PRTARAPVPIAPQGTPAHAEPGARNGGPGNTAIPRQRRVLVQSAPLGQEKRPVMFSAAYEWKCLTPGIRNIPGNVPAVLPRPPERNTGRVPVPAAPEGNNERQRDEQLQHRSTQRRQHLATPAENQVAGLVDGQIERVQQMIPVRRREVP